MAWSESKGRGNRGRVGDRRGGRGGRGGGSSYRNPPPPRGFPAVLVTCESGRERKCQREALELIHHYYYLSRTDGDGADGKEAAKPSTTTEGDTQDATAPTAHETSTPSDDAPLSLEEELAMLRKGAAAEEVLSYERDAKRPRHNDSHGSTKSQSKTMKSPFVIHDVGIRGMMCIVCTLPGCEFVPYEDIIEKLRPPVGKTNSGLDDTGNTKNGDDFVLEEKEVPVGTKEEDEATPNNTESELEAATNQSPLWDPVVTVKSIMSEIASSAEKNEDAAGVADSVEKKEEIKTAGNATKDSPSTNPPGSRFITRMIPIQATVSR
eukprot:scaffold237_cov181-Alexandrium_tamarense.AAC.32